MSNPVTTHSPVLHSLVAAGVLAVVGDYLLWPAMPGLSLALFAVAAAIAALLQQPAAFSRPASLAAFLLLLVTAAQSAIEISMSNLLVLVVSLAAVIGEAHLAQVPSLLWRAVEGALAIVRAPARWPWVVALAARLPIRSERVGTVAHGALQIGVPTVAISAVFAVLLGNGNAIMAHGFDQAFKSVMHLVEALDISIWHAFFLLLLATLALGITCPVSPVVPATFIGFEIPLHRPPPALSLAVIRSCAILAALNALFFWANTIDAFYLWVNRALPAAVNYSEYVHQGVWALSSAVVLSAAVLIVIMQQAPSVTGSRTLRMLSYAWIVQNLVLTAGVLLRLHLYVTTYGLTELRLDVAFFLLLVCAGFALLTWRIARGKTLGWLIEANLLATLALFATVQFLDTSAWIANYNVDAWKRSHFAIDESYIESLGPSAYPALIQLAEGSRRAESEQAMRFLLDRQASEADRLGKLNWRSLQFRHEWNAHVLLTHTLPHSPGIAAAASWQGDPRALGLLRQPH